MRAFLATVRLYCLSVLVPIIDPPYLVLFSETKATSELFVLAISRLQGSSVSVRL